MYTNRPVNANRNENREDVYVNNNDDFKDSINTASFIIYNHIYILYIYT